MSQIKNQFNKIWEPLFRRIYKLLYIRIDIQYPSSIDDFALFSIDFARASSAFGCTAENYFPKSYSAFPIVVAKKTPRFQ